MSKSKKRKNPLNLPQIDMETAQRHLSAYYYAAYSNCQCDACLFLRPVALKMIEALKKGEIKKVVVADEQQQKQS
jgi:invasion protein IalB